MSTRALLVVLVVAASVGVLGIWLSGPDTRGLAPHPRATPIDREVADAEADQLLTESPSDEASSITRTESVDPPRFNKEDPRLLPVVLVLPEGTPPRERATLVATAWKSEDGQDRWPLFGDWDEIDRVEAAGPGPGLFLRIPRDAESVRVTVEADYLYLPDRVELDDLDDLDSLRLELLLAGRLQFRLVPAVDTALDPSSLVGASVELHSMRASAGYRFGSPGIRSGAIGKNLVVEFGGLRPDYTYELSGAVPPYAPFETETMRAAPGETIEFEVPVADGLELHGRVLDPDGEPISVGSLWVSYGGERGSGGRAYDVVGERGEFHLTGVRPGWSAVSYKREGFLEAEVARDQLPEGRVVEGIVLQVRRGESLGGTVVLPDGRPVSGVVVELREPGEEYGVHHTETDAQGCFRLTGLEEGEFVAVAEASFDGSPDPEAPVVPSVRYGFSRGGWLGEARVMAGDEAVEVRLVAPAELIGRAEDDQGRPIDHVKLRAVPDQGGAIGRTALFFADHETSLQTKEGEFRWGDLPPGKWIVSASASGYSVPPPVRVEIPGEDHPVFVFEARLQLTGRVLDPSGAPLPGAKIERIEVRGGVHYLNAVNDHADANGDFEVEVDASTYLFFAVARGYAPSEQREVVVRPGAASDPIVLVVRPGGRLVCEVQDRDGQPVPAEHVQVEGIVSAGWGSHETDAAGRLVIEDLAPGTYHLSAWLGRGQSDPIPLRTSAEIKAGGTTQVLLGGPLEARLTVLGQVVSDGGPVASCVVKLYPRDRSASPSRVRTDTHGRFVARLEVGGTTSVVLEVEGSSAYRDAVELPQSGEHEIQFELPSAGVRGVVTSPHGELPWGLEVHLHPVGPDRFAGRRALRVPLREDGIFEALHIEAGTYSLVAAPDPDPVGFHDGEPVGGASLLVTLASGEIVEDLKLHLPRPGVLDVKVVDEQGAAVAGAMVHVYDSSGRPITARPFAGEGGRASISNLPHGAVLLLATAGERVSPQPVGAAVSEGEIEQVELTTVPGATLELELPEDVNPRDLILSVSDGGVMELNRGIGTWYFDPLSHTRTLSPIPPGKWTVLLTGPGGSKTSMEIELAPGEKRALVLDFP